MFNAKNFNLNNKSIENKTDSNRKPPKNDIKKRLVIFSGIIIGIIVIIFVVLWVMSLFSNKTYSHESVESVMVSAAEKYMNDHKKRLPQDEMESVVLNVSDLVGGEYMNELTHYLGEDSKCSGYVEVSVATSGGHRYVAYLTCQDGYETTELYKRVLDQDVVATGYGLYKINEDYVFRGEIVANYLKLGESRWRIIKVTSTNDIVIVYDGTLGYGHVWDDRYNSTIGFSSGFNDYGVSRIYEALLSEYKSSGVKDALLNLTDDMKDSLTSFTQCIGKRDPASDVRDGSVECSGVLEEQMVGLLTINDYMNASTDVACVRTTDAACQNYNYLQTNKPWWTATGSATGNSKVYMVDSSGKISEKHANVLARLRPVLTISSEALYKSGDGTFDNPYIIR